LGCREGVSTRVLCVYAAPDVLRHLESLRYLCMLTICFDPTPIPCCPPWQLGPCLARPCDVQRGQGVVVAGAGVVAGLWAVWDRTPIALGMKARTTSPTTTTVCGLIGFDALLKPGGPCVPLFPPLPQSSPYR
jgi:hypothetical protein